MWTGTINLAFCGFLIDLNLKTKQIIQKNMQAKESRGGSIVRITLISILILFALALSCQSLDPVVISRDNGIAILANLTESSVNLSATLNTLENKTNLTTNLTDNSSPQTADDLWSWGRIPIGYEVDRNGSLIRLSGQEWAPSI